MDDSKMEDSKMEDSKREDSKMDPAAAVYEQLLSRMRTVREIEEKGDSEIQQLYRGSTVFITGGTGFLGKQLLEKLLRACCGIKKIYLLTRSKKGKTMEEIFAETLQDPVFDQLRNINPQFNESIVLIEGDISKLKLGIKDEDWKTLTEEVNFIYHLAATVLFNKPLKSAIIANVRGTREAITLARECHNLKSMVYMSTAYSHCNRKELLEMFYPSPITPATMIEMVESMDESRLDAMTPALIENRQNTYTFSKAVAEETVRVMGEGLPICVVRPAIVTPTLREPVPGWLDMGNVFGPSGILLGDGLGVTRTLLVRDDVLIDVVPVDYVNNLTIASSWETAKRFQRGEQDIKIYTCSRIRNRIRWGTYEKAAEFERWNYVSPKTMWYPTRTSTPNKNFFFFLTVLLHYIPALFIDGILKALGQKLRLGKIYRKVYKLNTVLSYFLLNHWDMRDDNTLDLSTKLSEADKVIFHFDVTDIQADTFMIIVWLGLRKYIIKDGLKGTEKASKRKPYLMILHYIVSALYFLLLWKVLTWSFSIVSFCSGNIYNLFDNAI